MKNNDFKKIPEELLIEALVFMYNLINAVLYHHLSVMKLFDTDDKLVKYLLNLIIFSLKFVLRT